MFQLNVMVVIRAKVKKWEQNTSIYSHALASFLGPTQLSVACSTEKTIEIFSFMHDESLGTRLAMRGDASLEVNGQYGLPLLPCLYITAVQKLPVIHLG